MNTFQPSRPPTGSGTRFSGAPLWRFALRREQRREAEAAENRAQAPEGFELQADGRYWHPTKKIFWDSQRCHRRGDSGQNEVVEENISNKVLELNLLADACGMGEVREEKHVLIRDLAKAAQALRAAVQFPRPAALYAIYAKGREAADTIGNSAKANVCNETSKAAGSTPEFCARHFHLHLLHELGRLNLADDKQVCLALRRSWEELGSSTTSRDQCSAAVALVLGQRLFTLLVGRVGAALFQEAGPDAGPDAGLEAALPGIAARSDDCPSSPSIQATSLEQRHACLVLGSARIFKELQESDIAFHLYRRRKRPRLASGALIQALLSPLTGLTVVAAYFNWVTALEGATGPPKKQRTSGGSQAQVRCRHILLKHAGIKEAFDHVRGQEVTRTVAQAQALLQEAADAVERLPTQTVFTQKCKAVSECASCLKGGDMAGDLGWIMRSQASPQVEAAVFALQVGEFSDIVESEEGLHVFWRIA